MEKGIGSILKFIAESTDVEKLVTVRERAETKHETNVADAVTKRLSELAVARGADPIEPAFDKMLEDDKKILGHPRQRTINAINSRVENGVRRRDAIIQKLSEWALVKGSRKGFDDLKSAGRLDAAGEALILRFSSYFPEHIVAAARGRLEAAGWQEPP
jgi:hypothetical protein